MSGTPNRKVQVPHFNDVILYIALIVPFIFIYNKHSFPIPYFGRHVNIDRTNDDDNITRIFLFDF